MEKSACQSPGVSVGKCRIVAKLLLVESGVCCAVKMEETRRMKRRDGTNVLLFMKSPNTVNITPAPSAGKRGNRTSSGFSTRPSLRRYSAKFNTERGGEGYESDRPKKRGPQMKMKRVKEGTLSENPHCQPKGKESQAERQEQREDAGENAPDKNHLGTPFQECTPTQPSKFISQDLGLELLLINAQIVQVGFSTDMYPVSRLQTDRARLAHNPFD